MYVVLLAFESSYIHFTLLQEVGSKLSCIRTGHAVLFFLERIFINFFVRTWFEQLLGLERVNKILEFTSFAYVIIFI